MASTQVIVRVLDGPSVVDESIRRPVRLTPDGFAGVVYAGAVYPLFPDNLVDIAGASWEIEDCNRFLFSGTAIPYAPRPGGATSEPEFNGFSGEWSVETNRFGHYVVFNASERNATHVVDTLEVAGLSVQRWDVSHRPAADGRFYDWFARLRFKGSRDECVTRVSAAFSATRIVSPAEEAPQPAIERLEESEAQVERLLDQVMQLRGRLVAAEEDSARLRVKLHNSMTRETQLTGTLDRALAHQKALDEQLATLRDSALHAPDTNALLAQQSETEELMELALAENAHLQQRIGGLLQKSDQDDGRILTLEATIIELQERLEEISEQERERHRITAARFAPRAGVYGFLDMAFTRLTLVLDSVEVLANFEAPASALRILVQIDMGDPIGKDLQGVRGWREVSKIATGIPGSEDKGRIYYKPGGNRVLVSIHLKQNDKEQRRHVKRLSAF
jgi:hypothetical protein